jgi:uncharacterized membrane protein (UPF0136 family)
MPMKSFPHAVRSAAMAAVSTVWLAPLAMAQEVAPQPPIPIPMESGVSLRINVDLVYKTAFGSDLQLVQNSFAAGAMGHNATSDYVFDLLNKAALAGLNSALQQGAKSGRVTVVASGCHVGVAGNLLQTVAPAGIFVNTTDMELGADGVAHFRTRVKFIPDSETAPGALSPDAPAQDAAPNG